jgi:hypothetical protein
MAVKRPPGSMIRAVDAPLHEPRSEPPTGPKDGGRRPWAPPTLRSVDLDAGTGGVKNVAAAEAGSFGPS